MLLLKREYFWFWIILYSIGGPILLAAILDCFKKDAWYLEWRYWVIGLIFILPFAIMINVLNFQMLAITSKKLGIAGSEYYLSPYIWLLLFIVPIFGWILLMVMILYLYIMTFIKLYNGAAEKYIIKK